MKQTVFLVDDDYAVLDSLQLFLIAAGLHVKSFARAEEFLSILSPYLSGCVVLDLLLPLTSGLQVQQALDAAGCIMPIIFITGDADVNSAVQALKAGAFDFVQKPFDNIRLLALINAALEQEQKQREAQDIQALSQERMHTLTRREREVLAYIINGAASKTIADELKLSTRTVEVYRANVMQKMQTKSVAQLVQMVGNIYHDSDCA